MTKRRDRGTGSLWQRKSDGMWLGAIDVGYVNGRRQRKVVSAKSKTRCQAKLRDAQRAVDAGDMSTSSMRLDKWLRYWLAEIAPQAEDKPLKPKTLVNYKSKVEHYIIPTVGHHKLDKLNPGHVRDMHKQLRTMKGPKGKPLSPTSIHHAHRVLSTALNAARREVGLTRNVAEKGIVAAPAKAKPNRGALSLAEARASIKACQDDPMTATRRLAAFMTGARQGELLGLRWSHITGDVADFAWSLQRVPYKHGCLKRDEPTCGKRPASCPKRELDINPALEWEQLHGGLCLLRPKTEGSKRIVPLAPPVPDALRLLRAADAGPNPHGLVWHMPNGDPISPKDDWSAWKQLLADAGVRPLTLHEIRHSTVTLLSDMGIDERTIASIVGHSDVLTQASYRHRSIELERTALSRLGEALAIGA